MITCGFLVELLQHLLNKSCLLQTSIAQPTRNSSHRHCVSRFPSTGNQRKMSEESMEKADTMQVTEEPTPAVERPESSEPEHEKPEELTTSSIEDPEEPVPHLHAKTFLTVFAVCLIYFAQLINVVGAGAVRTFHTASPCRIYLMYLLACSRHFRCSRGLSKQRLVDILSCHSDDGSQSTSITSGRLLGKKMVFNRTYRLRSCGFYHSCSRNFNEHGHCW